MKTHFASLFLLIAALATISSAPLSAALHDASAHAVSVQTADFNGCHVTRGTPARKMLNPSITIITARLETRAPVVVASTR